MRYLIIFVAAAFIAAICIMPSYAATYQGKKVGKGTVSKSSPQPSVRPLHKVSLDPGGGPPERVGRVGNVALGGGGDPHRNAGLVSPQGGGPPGDKVSMIGPGGGGPPPNKVRVVVPNLGGETSLVGSGAGGGPPDKVGLVSPEGGGPPGD